MVRINRVYTRTGDAGQTRLVGGQEVPKTHPRLDAYGTVDELNAVLGVAREALDGLGTGDGPRLHRFLERVQQRLFDVGSELATLPEDQSEHIPQIPDREVTALEEEIDALNEGLEPLKSFVLPGGGPAGAALHVARTVCRRAEREVLRLQAESPVRGEVVRYLNRLSDYLFVASRAAARAAGREETLWTPGGGS